MGKLTLSGYIEVPEAALEAVRKELPRHIALTREEEGCIVFKVVQDESCPNRFNVHEEFLDEESFKRHQERIKTSEWSGVTAGVGRHYTIERQR